MTLSIIGATRIPHPILSPVQPADRYLEDAPQYDTSSNQNAVDNAPFSFGEPGELEIVETSRSQAVLTVKSHTWLKQTDDGRIKVKSKSWLKFSYEFETEDGTTVKLRARAKARVSYTQIGEESLEFRARVKFQLSIVQETVESGLAPVLDSDEIADEQRSAISSALQYFGDIVDRLTTQFVDDTLIGDDLVAEVVSAFNELTQSVQSGLLPEDEPPIVPAQEPLLDVSGEVVDDPVPPAALTDQDVSPVDITTVEDEFGSDVGESSDADQAIAQPVGDVDVTDDGEMVEVETQYPPEIPDGPAEAQMPAVTDSYFYQSLFLNLRVKFVQSLSHLVAVLDSPPDDADMSRENKNTWGHIRFDIRLAAYSRTRAWVGGQPGINVDAEA